MQEVVSNFLPSTAGRRVLYECMENYSTGDAGAEWPNNIISRKTVVYTSGVIARDGETLTHSVYAKELNLCKRLSAEVGVVTEHMEVGMGSEASDPFGEFFISATIDEPAPENITPALIRAKFNGTIFPPATITVEPLEESGIWWSEVLQDAGDYVGEELEQYLQPWRCLIDWFQNNNELKHASFVRIGDSRLLGQIPKDQYPAGTIMSGCVLPRLAIGMSSCGSLIGVFGHVTHT